MNKNIKDILIEKPQIIETVKIKRGDTNIKKYVDDKKILTAINAAKNMFDKLKDAKEEQLRTLEVTLLLLRLKQEFEVSEGTPAEEAFKKTEMAFSLIEYALVEQIINDYKLRN